MTWLLDNWQTIAALGVVALTALVFARHLTRGKRKAGCGGGCACVSQRKDLMKSG